MSEFSLARQTLTERMTWPILIAGFNMAVDDPSRSAALEFLCEFEYVTRFISWDNTDVQASCLLRQCCCLSYIARVLEV